MIIVGAKGFAKEVLQIVSVDMKIPDDEIVFFDDVSKDLSDLIFNKFRILTSYVEVKTFLSNSKSKEFILGLGNSKHRKMLFEKLQVLGAIPKTIISSSASIGSFNVSIGLGSSLMSGSVISNEVKIGKAALIYYNVAITHDCVIGDFVEISPNVSILGRCKIGDNTFLGAGTTVLPDVVIGDNVIVGAGTVVLKDVPNNSVIVGVPGKIIKKLDII